MEIGSERLAACWVQSHRKDIRPSVPSACSLGPTTGHVCVTGAMTSRPSEPMRKHRVSVIMASSGLITNPANVFIAAAIAFACIAVLHCALLTISSVCLTYASVQSRTSFLQTEKPLHFTDWDNKCIFSLACCLIRRSLAKNKNEEIFHHKGKWFIYFQKETHSATHTHSGGQCAFVVRQKDPHDHVSGNKR